MEGKILIQQPTFNHAGDGLFSVQDINGNAIFKFKYSTMKTDIRSGMVAASPNPTNNGVFYYDGSAYLTSDSIFINNGVLSVGDSGTNNQALKTELYGIIKIGTQYTANDQDQQPTGAFCFDELRQYYKNQYGWLKNELVPLDSPTMYDVKAITSGAGGYPNQAGMNAAFPNAVKGMIYYGEYSGDIFACVKDHSDTWHNSEPYNTPS